MTINENEKESPRKMNYEEFFEVFVGKAARMENEINKKFEELTEWLLKELQEYAVDNNLPIPQGVLDKNIAQGEKTSVAVALCPSGCGTKLEIRKFCYTFDEKNQPDPKEIEEGLYCLRCKVLAVWAFAALPEEDRRSIRRTNTTKK